MDVGSSILDQDPDPQPAGDESPDPEGEQSPMDICEPPLAAAQALEKVSVFVQTEGVRVCTQSVQTKKKARSIETESTPSGDQTSVNKYIVFETCLEKLVKRCPQCLSIETQVAFHCVGSMVQATITCSAEHVSSWECQPRCHGRPVGNILICSAIVFSGGSPTKVLRLFDIMGVASIQSTQFYEYQRCYLLPAVMNGARYGWLVTVGLTLPAFLPFTKHTPLLETTVNRIIHLELVKSTEVKSSCHMELEGLDRSLTYFAKEGLTVEVIVADRHMQVIAYMKREHPLIQHRFDLWHVSKVRIKKKIVALAKSPRQKSLEKWLETITRHLYWCARTSNGQGDLILAKWTSITRHISDVHHHVNSLHPAFLHGILTDRLWIEEGTETFKKLESVVLSNHLLRDIPKLSSDEQTFALEAFHGVLVHFASKSVGYCYEGLLARTYIAALHFNSNADRKIRQADNGDDKYALKFSRGRKHSVDDCSRQGRHRVGVTAESNAGAKLTRQGRGRPLI
ncbi:hypothetical protein HPB47_022891 [Ixodes persulcatus]|uniref:Uncharacterized protein n=1 Tax=Ixodes persulcatus TaxID=34615 RepID=A0AC60QAG3_IXOPE|nr:hypothetical protein HPB47_022891 [Ixodes persulcatus]